MVAVAKAASYYHISHMSFSVHKYPVWETIFPNWLTESLYYLQSICKVLSSTPFRNFSDLLVTALPINVWEVTISHKNKKFLLLAYGMIHQSYRTLNDICLVFHPPNPHPEDVSLIIP